MRKLTIAVDMDDVLVDICWRWLDIYNRDWCDTLIPSDIRSWGWHEYVKPECGWKVYDILSMPGFFLDAPAADDALEVMERLSSLHDVIVATASPRCSETAYNEKLEWVRRNMPWFPERNFMSIHRKDLIDADVLFDDGPHNLASFRGISIRKTQPWNDNPITLCDFTADTWENFGNWIDLLASNQEDCWNVGHSLAERRLRYNEKRIADYAPSILDPRDKDKRRP